MEKKSQTSTNSKHVDVGQCVSCVNSFATYQATEMRGSK